MQRAVKISTGFPSAAKAAKTLGVSKKVTKRLVELARRSRETGEYSLPGVAPVVRTGKKSSRGAGVKTAATARKSRTVKISRNGTSRSGKQ